MQSNTASRQRLPQQPDRAGLDFAELDAQAVTDADALDAEIAANQAALEGAGHWGGADIGFGGEPFFGQDRIEMAIRPM